MNNYEGEFKCIELIAHKITSSDGKSAIVIYETPSERKAREDSYKENKLMIVKTFFGTHIDLSKVVSISDAEIINSMYSSGMPMEVGFRIIVQLRDQPIDYTRPLERTYEYTDSVIDNTFKRELVYLEDGITPLAVKRLQDQIDLLIEQWKGSKINESSRYY